MAAWNESLNKKEWKKTSVEETEACNKSCPRNKEILLLFNIVTVFLKGCCCTILLAILHKRSLKKFKNVTDTRGVVKVQLRYCLPQSSPSSWL